MHDKNPESEALVDIQSDARSAFQNLRSLIDDFKAVTEYESRVLDLDEHTPVLRRATAGASRN